MRWIVLLGCVLALVGCGQQGQPQKNSAVPSSPKVAAFPSQPLNARQQLPPLNAGQKALWQKFRGKRMGYVVAGYSRPLGRWILNGATPLEVPADGAIGGLVGPVDATAADIYAKEWTEDTPATAVLDLFSQEKPVIVHCYVDTRKGRVKYDRPPDADLAAGLHNFIREQQLAAISKEEAPNPSEGAILVCLAVARAADPADAIVKQLTAKEGSSRLKAAKAVAALGDKGAKYDYALIAAMAKDYPNDREVYLEALQKIRPDLHKPVVTILVDKSGENCAEAVKAIRVLGYARDGGYGAVPVLVLKYFEEKERCKNAMLPFFGYPILLMETLAWVARSDPATFVVLKDALTEREPRGSDQTDLKRAAMLTVRQTKMPPKEVIPLLIAALPEEEYALTAVTILGSYKGAAKSAIPALRKLLLSETAEVRKAAEKAIAAIQGEKP